MLVKLYKFGWTCSEGNAEISLCLDLGFYFWDCNIPIHMFINLHFKNIPIQWNSLQLWERVKFIFRADMRWSTRYFYGSIARYGRGSNMLLSALKTHFHCKEFYLNVSLPKLCVRLKSQRALKGLNKTAFLFPHFCSLEAITFKSFSSFFWYLPSYFKITCLYQYFLIDFIFSILTVDFLQWKIRI